MKNKYLERTVVIQSSSRFPGPVAHDLKAARFRDFFTVDCVCGFHEIYPTPEKARWFARNHPKLMRMRRSRYNKLIREAEHLPPPAGYASLQGSPIVAGGNGKGCGHGPKRQHASRAAGDLPQNTCVETPLCGHHPHSEGQGCGALHPRTPSFKSAGPDCEVETHLCRNQRAGCMVRPKQTDRTSSR